MAVAKEISVDGATEAGFIFSVFDGIFTEEASH